MYKPEIISMQIPSCSILFIVKAVPILDLDFPSITKAAIVPISPRNQGITQKWVSRHDSSGSNSIQDIDIDF